MKRIFILLQLLSVLFVTTVSAQTSDPKVNDVIKQLQQKPGKFTVKSTGKSSNGKAIFVKLANNKGFAVTNEMIESQGVQTFALQLPKATAGKYPLEKTNNLVTLEGITYEIKEGEIILTVKGGKISGTFSGNIYSINKSKSKFDVPAGKATGTFSGLTKP